MVFLDANIPMYLVGAPHPNRDKAVAELTRLSRAAERLVTDAEVFQEILHRYVAIARRDIIQPAFDVLIALADSVLPVDFASVERGKNLVLAYPGLTARDAIHVAVMESAGIQTILTFDTGFDVVPGFTRLPVSSTQP